MIVLFVSLVVHHTLTSVPRQELSKTVSTRSEADFFRRGHCINGEAKEDWLPLDFVDTKSAHHIPGVHVAKGKRGPGSATNGSHDLLFILFSTV